MALRSIIIGVTTAVFFKKDIEIVKHDTFPFMQAIDLIFPPSVQLHHSSDKFEDEWCLLLLLIIYYIYITTVLKDSRALVHRFNLLYVGLAQCTL